MSQSSTELWDVSAYIFDAVGLLAAPGAYGSFWPCSLSASPKLDNFSYTSSKPTLRTFSSPQAIPLSLLNSHHSLLLSLSLSLFLFSFSFRIPYIILLLHKNPYCSLQRLALKSNQHAGDDGRNSVSCHSSRLRRTASSSFRRGSLRSFCQGYAEAGGGCSAGPE